MMMRERIAEVLWRRDNPQANVVSWALALETQKQQDPHLLTQWFDLADEVLAIVQPELNRLYRIERAARSYVDSDPPRPEWRELTHALGDPDQNVWDALDGKQPIVHPIVGVLHPHEKPCSSFMPDGRSEICARCDWPDEAHDSRGN